MFRVVVLCCALIYLPLLKSANAEKPGDASASTGRDSYLSAYAVTKKLNEKSDTNGFYPHDIHHEYHDDGYDYYGPPKPIYGPPKPIYGPPAPYPPPHYNPYPPPPPPHYGPPEPAIPHALLGILDKIKYKIDLLTIGKIILKLFIFKKIVAWIGVICLLLFIPSLKKKHIFTNNNIINNGDDDDLLRSFNSRQQDADERIDNLKTFVMDSLRAFTTKYNETDCQSIYCRSQKFQSYIDSKLTYGRLAELYTKEL